MGSNGSGSITWAEFVAIFVEVLGTTQDNDGVSSSNGFTTAVTVDEDTCQRAFDLLSNGSTKISAATLRELFFPSSSGRVLSYEVRDQTSSRRLINIPTSLKRPCIVPEILLGSLDSEKFMRMLREVDAAPPES